MGDGDIDEDIDAAGIADTVIGPGGTGAPRSQIDDEDTIVRSAIAPPAPFRGRDRASNAENTVVPSPNQFARASSRAPYRVSVNGDGALILDSPVLIGRNPRGPRVSTGAAARLVTVQSIHQEVSSTHLEVHQHGASVIVTDMKSTNGTEVIMPGQAPLRLRPGDSVVAVPGTLVNIGDGNSVEILAVERLVPPKPALVERLSS